MNNEHYSRNITVSADPINAYHALTSGIEYWWTKPNTPLNTVGDQAKFSFSPGKSYWIFEAIKLIPNSRVELLCIDAMHLHEGLPKEIEKEWLGTKVVFSIEDKGKETVIHFEHIGLNAKLLCYGVCEAGWDFFFLDSLKEYLDTGIGKPHV